MWEISSVSVSVRLLARQAENFTSGRGSFWERSPLGAWFSTSAFRNVPGTVSENVRICWWNSSNVDRALIMRDFVLLNSWDSFLVTLPSISSEACAMYSSVIPGADEFYDWFFLGYFCVSLARAANYRLFSEGCHLREKVQQWWRLNYFVFSKQFLSLTKM